MAIGQVFNPNNFDVVPLPQGLPSIDLPKISIAKILEGDVEEAKTVFDTCSRTGFFYLNLMDHPIGRKLWKDACIVRNITQELSKLPMEVKKKYLTRPEGGVLDRGYFFRDENHRRTPLTESISIPSDEMFARNPTGWKLPEWLQAYEGTFKEIQKTAHDVMAIVLGVLEKGLQLEPGTLNNCHRLEDPTHSWLRILRYPGLENGAKLQDGPRFFAHRDIVSVTMLFTWVCGLQLPKENPDMIGPDTETEDSWRWVRPEAGCAIVNLGDSMPIFSNGKLASGKHRVATPNDQQASLERISVVLSSRPNLETPMRSFVSPIIPLQTEEDVSKPVESCGVWGDRRIGMIQSKDPERT